MLHYYSVHEFYSKLLYFKFLSLKIPFVVHISKEQFYQSFMYIISFIHLILYKTIYIVYIAMERCCPLFMYIISFIYITLHNAILYSLWNNFVRHYVYNFLLYTLYYIIPFYIVHISMEQFCPPFMYIISFIHIILYNTILYSLHSYGTILSAIYVYNFFYIHYTT